ncbi:MAG: VWA domain-containing protein [Chloroflexota bacterium]
MKTYRYSEWDGSQDFFSADAEELMNELGRRMMSYGDLSQVLRSMQQGGLRDSQGRRLPTLQELLQRLQQRKQSQLEKYNLNSVLEDIKQRLDDIIKQEREGIQKKLDETKRKSEESAGELGSEVQKKLSRAMQEKAAQNLKKLNELPPDIGGKIKELTDYDFMDEEAHRQFAELMDMLKRHAMESYGQDLLQRVKGMDPSALTAMRNLVEAINQMLEQRLKGEEPDFQRFMEEFGNYFGGQPPENLDKLIERLQNQMAQAQSLMDSLPPEARQELENLLQSMLDEATKYELAKLTANMEALHPSDKLHKQYPFSGEESISYNEALKLMEMLQKMDELETQLKEAQYSRSLESLDEKLLKQLLGEQAAEELERLRNITKLLEEAGYIRWKNDRFELTPRGTRKIGQKALEDIFAQLRKSTAGGHNIKLRGTGGERLEDTKKYEFGDDFQLHFQKTLMNTLYRAPKAPPLKMSIDDFEVYKSEGLTRSATVLMLDLSLSMPMRGNFQAAKQVAVALDNLIRTQYPKDTLYIVGFSSYARRIKKEDIAYLGWDEFDPYTNIQHGLHVAAKLLDKEKCTNKQIIMISDGEPTAHFEGGHVFFQYPPSLRTLQLTLREVRQCTRKGIVINTFMLESGRFFGAFVNEVTRINKGRVFYTGADSLGQYLLVDYISNKRKRI